MFDICGHICQNVAFALACFDSACQNVVWRDRYLGNCCHTFVIYGCVCGARLSKICVLGPAFERSVGWKAVFEAVKRTRHRIRLRSMDQQMVSHTHTGVCACVYACL